MKSILSLLLFCSTLWVNAQSNDSIKPSPQGLVNMQMPNIKETSITGNAWNAETLKGKVVVVNFWFIGCPRCMKEIKYLNRLNEKYKNDNFVLLSIAPHIKQDLIDFNSDSINRHSRIRKHYLDKAKIEYEIIAECSERNSKPGPDCDNISSLFNVIGYPTSFIINKKGIIEHAKVGFGFESENSEGLEYSPDYEKIIDKLLAK